MRIFLTKFNWWHIAIILAFPIVLAFINPNWIFNVSIADDYIYLGYQLDLPKYVGWFPSADHYFIERISWIAPFYYVYQILPPILANLLIHLWVYYVAVFSIYGILNRLYNERVALLGVLLIGQFSIFIRSTGWDYVDGYSMALYSLCLLFLTYATTSPLKYARWYMIMAGGFFSLMITAQFFNTFYTPSIVIYYLLLNWKHKQYHILYPIIFGGLGALSFLIIQTGYYYLLTNRWFLFDNTLSTAQSAVSPEGWRNLINNRPEIGKTHLPIFFIMVCITALQMLIFPRFVSPNHTTPSANRNAIIALFATAFGVMAGWALLGYWGYLRLSLYNTNILVPAFLVISIFLSRYINPMSSTQWHRTIIGVLFISWFWFAILTQLTVKGDFLFWVAIAGIFCAIYILPLFTIKRFALFLSLHGVIFLSFLAGYGVRNIAVFIPDRYLHQSRFELTLQAVDIISPRYDDFSMENFRFWFTVDDPNWRVFEAIASIYLYGWGRIVDVPLSELSLSSAWDEKLIQSDEIILLTSDDIHSALSTANAYLHRFDYEAQLVETYTLQDWDANIHIIFIQVLPRQVVTPNQLFYGLGAVVDENITLIGFHNPETANNRTYRWTSDPLAQMTFALDDAIFDAEQSYQVQFWALAPLEAEVLDSLTLTINGVELALERIPQGADTLFQATIDGQILQGDVLELTFETDRISRPADFGYADSRTLGVALDWLTIAPIEDETP